MAFQFDDRGRPFTPDCYRCHFPLIGELCRIERRDLDPSFTDKRGVGAVVHALCLQPTDHVSSHVVPCTSDVPTPCWATAEHENQFHKGPCCLPGLFPNGHPNPVVPVHYGPQAPAPR
jgi:hypothetical protein